MPLSAYCVFIDKNTARFTHRQMIIYGQASSPMNGGSFLARTTFYSTFSILMPMRRRYPGESAEGCDMPLLGVFGGQKSLRFFWVESYFVRHIMLLIGQKFNWVLNPIITALAPLYRHRWCGGLWSLHDVGRSAWNLGCIQWSVHL